MKAIRLGASAWIVATMVLGGAGCGKDQQTITGPGGTSGPPTATALSISGAFAPVLAGQTGQLTASLVFSNGTTEVLQTGVLWTSSDPAIATVSSDGLVTAAGGIGLANITATYLKFGAIKIVSVLLAVKSIKVTGNLALTAVGQSSQLTVIGTLPDGSTRDITSVSKYETFDPAVVGVTQGGAILALGLGVGYVDASYPSGFAGTPTSRQEVIVTPAGTYVARGIVKHPGHGGVTGFHVMDTQSGRSVTSGSEGVYTIAAVTGSTRLAFDKAGFEPAELVVNGSPGNLVSADVLVQPLIRITAGQTAQTTIAPKDLEYDVSPTERCVKCQLIRVISPGAGTLHLSFTWDRPSISLTAWVGGQAFPGPAAGPLEADVTVGAGETVWYVGVGSGALTPSDVLTVTVTTSFAGMTGTRPALRRQ